MGEQDYFTNTKSIVHGSLINISVPLYMASFTLNYPNRAPVGLHIIENYDAWVGVLSNC